MLNKKIFGVILSVVLAAVPVSNIFRVSAAEEKVFDIEECGGDISFFDWTVSDGVTVSKSDIYTLEMPASSKIVMGGGYGAECQSIEVEFMLSAKGAAKGASDICIYDIDGEPITGWCYAVGSDGFCIGHGERSFGGVNADMNGTKRFENYLKTEISLNSASDKTGKFNYEDNRNICKIAIDNYNGSVSDVMYNAVNGSGYTGRYYTVSVYCDDSLISKEYYSGNRSGIGAIESAKGILTCYGGLKIYAEKGEIPEVAKITEQSYSFVEDTIKSGGSANSGEVLEWSVNSVPQYFYVDTVEADAIKDVVIRSGYEKNSAVTAVYAYDNGGLPVNEEQLRSFCEDNSALIPIGSICDSKTASWGYRTAEISANGVKITDGSESYSILDTSNALNTNNIKGKQAIIVGISGNIGTKAYFDSIILKYNREVTAPAPPILGIMGDGVKDTSVEIDNANKTVIVPVIPGTDKSKLNLEILIGKSASAELTDGTWADGEITVKYGDDTRIWTIECVDRGNPVLNGFYADPNIAYFDGKYYIYPTTDGGVGWDAPYFKCFSSDDLVNWQDEGVILDLKDVEWSNGLNGWAPTIAEKDGKYCFYYSAAPKDNGAKDLAVAVSDSPTGPFEDKGVIIEGGKLSGQMIDSAVFMDDDGSSYLYWGNGKMYMAKLSEDMLSIDGEIREITPSNFREAAFVIKRNGVYYFMWSDNDTGEPTYEVHYGTAKSPYGPIEGDTTILSFTNANDSRIKATGHHSVVNIPGTDKWYICYHRFNIPLYGKITNKNSAAGNHRETCIDKMEFDEYGNIKPVRATLEGIMKPINTSENDLSVSVNAGWVNGVIEYEATLKNEKNIECDLCVAAYNKNGELKNVTKNKVSGKIDVDGDIYTVKAMVWEKDGVKPLCETDSIILKNR